MIQMQILIGADSLPITVFKNDGTRFDTPPCVVLHSVEQGKYFVAGTVTLNQDGRSYDAVFRGQTTVNMQPAVYALEVYTDSSKSAMLYYQDDYAEAVIAATTPGQVQPWSPIIK